MWTMAFNVVFFFFSSRRRHTRCSRDWSSDVCSSDLSAIVTAPVQIAPARGRLGVLLVGLGAVATTTIAGVFAIRKGLAPPIGSLTQMGTIRLGKRTEGRSPKIKEFVPLADLNDIVFGGSDT